MNELPDLIAMIFPVSKIARIKTMGRTKFPYAINYGLKKCFLESVRDR